MIFAEFAAAPPRLLRPLVIRSRRDRGPRKGLIQTRDRRGVPIYRLPPGTPVPAPPPAAPRSAAICARRPAAAPRCVGGRLFWQDSTTICCAPK